jgi:hypothetical protein
MTLAGLNVVEVRMLSPVGNEGLLKELPIGEFVGPKCAALIQSANQNIQQLNSILYGYQDYCIIGEAR